jgi:hypothetical protein
VSAAVGTRCLVRGTPTPEVTWRWPPGRYAPQPEPHSGFLMPYGMPFASRWRCKIAPRQWSFFFYLATELVKDKRKSRDGKHC